MSITIKDIARESGVSISTVSKIINGSPTISQPTIDRVNSIIDKYSYVPNERARSFAKRATRCVAFVTRFGKDTAFTEPHMFEIMAGVQQAVSAKGYSLSIISVADDADEESTIRRIVAEQSADGIVVHGSAITPKIQEPLCNPSFPHIIIGKPQFESRLCWMDTSNHLAGELAAAHLCDIGCHSIAFVGGLPTDGMSQQRLHGFKNMLEQRGLPILDQFIKNSDSTHIHCRQVMLELLKAGIPDGIVCENNSIALGVFNAIKESGLRVPQDIAVITFDDYPLSRIFEPMLTVVNIDVFDMGQQAGGILLRTIKKPMLHTQAYITLPQLILRESTNRLQQ